MRALLLVLGILGLVLVVYALLDVVRTPAAAVRALPKWLWLLVVLLLPVVGPVAWLGAGRPPRAATGPPSRPSSPDDDEDFLRSLRRWRREGDEPA